MRRRARSLVRTIVPRLLAQEDAEKDATSVACTSDEASLAGDSSCSQDKAGADSTRQWKKQAEEELRRWQKKAAEYDFERANAVLALATSKNEAEKAKAAVTDLQEEVADLKDEARREESLLSWWQKKADAEKEICQKWQNKAISAEARLEKQASRLVAEIGLRQKAEAEKAKCEESCHERLEAETQELKRKIKEEESLRRHIEERADAEESLRRQLERAGYHQSKRRRIEVKTEVKAEPMDEASWSETQQLKEEVEDWKRKASDREEELRMLSEKAEAAKAALRSQAEQLKQEIEKWKKKSRSKASADEEEDEEEDEVRIIQVKAGAKPSGQTYDNGDGEEAVDDNDENDEDYVDNEEEEEAEKEEEEEEEEEEEAEDDEEEEEQGKKVSVPKEVEAKEKKDACWRCWVTHVFTSFKAARKAGKRPLASPVLTFPVIEDPRLGYSFKLYLYAHGEGDKHRGAVSLFWEPQVDSPLRDELQWPIPHEKVKIALRILSVSEDAATGRRQHKVKEIVLDGAESEGFRAYLAKRTPGSPSNTAGFGCARLLTKGDFQEGGWTMGPDADSMVVQAELILK